MTHARYDSKGGGQRWVCAALGGERLVLASSTQRQNTVHSDTVKGLGVLVDDLLACGSRRSSEAC
jgi:hypothetical protein